MKAHQVLHSHEDSNPGDPGAAPEADDSGNPEASNKPEILVKPEFVRPDETANSDAALEPGIHIRSSFKVAMADVYYSGQEIHTTIY